MGEGEGELLMVVQPVFLPKTDVPHNLTTIPKNLQKVQGFGVFL